MGWERGERVRWGEREEGGVGRGEREGGRERGEGGVGEGREGQRGGEKGMEWDG